MGLHSQEERTRRVGPMMPRWALRRGLVARAEDRERSSARCHAWLRPVKLEMDQETLREPARG